jgi:hypothetical protein
MDLDNYSSDDDTYEEISDNKIPEEVIRKYKDALKKNTLSNVRQNIIYLLNQYDIERKLTNFENEMFEIYENVIEHYIYYQSPLEVFDANKYNLGQQFIQWAYSSTDRGIELKYLENIYFTLV